MVDFSLPVDDSKKSASKTFQKFDMSKQVVKTRNCLTCGEEYSFDAPANLANFGPQYCDPCAIKASQAIDERRAFDIVPDLVLMSGIPDAYQIWDDAKAKEVGGDKLRPWVEARINDSIWVGGGNGIGKTHTVMYVAYDRIIRTATPCRTVRCSSWFRNQSTLRCGDRRARAEASVEFMKVARTPLLILDDLGKEKMSEVKAELLYDLIDIRERDGLKLWITTNRSGSSLRKRLNGNGDHDHGDAVLTRLKRMIPRVNIFKGAENESR